jgi:hypothetical protein
MVLSTVFREKKTSSGFSKRKVRENHGCHWKRNVPLEKKATKYLDPVVEDFYFIVILY